MGGGSELLYFISAPDVSHSASLAHYTPFIRSLCLRTRWSALENENAPVVTTFGVFQHLPQLPPPQPPSPFSLNAAAPYATDSKGRKQFDGGADYSNPI